MSAGLILLGAFGLGLLIMLVISAPAWLLKPGADPAPDSRLARWTCSAEEQQRFLRGERARLLRQVGRQLLLALLGGAVMGVFLALVVSLNRRPAGPLGGLTPWGVAALIAGMAFGAAPLGNRYLNLHSLLARYGPGRPRAGGEVVIRASAVTLFGETFRLAWALTHVRRVTLVPGDPACLDFETRTAGARNSVTIEHIYVPIAAGRQAEAQALLAQFPVRP